MTPPLAALSIAEIAARICSGVRSDVERICFCCLRRCVLTLRLCAARLIVCRARLPADLVLAIGYQEVIERTLRFYKRLFVASFAFCRAPARAPAVRICSTLSELEGGIASMAALICGGGCGVTFAAFAAVISAGGCAVTFAIFVAAICGGACAIFAPFGGVICDAGSCVTLARFVEAIGAGDVVFVATTPPLIS